MRVPKAVTMLLVGSLAGAPALYAQGAEFSLGGGLSIPSSTFNDVAKLGWHGLVGVSFVPTNWPVGIQVDGQYHQFKLDNDVVGPGSLKDRIIMGTGDIVYKFKTSETTKFRPYILCGGGVYNLKTTGSSDLGTIASTTGSTTKFGLNAGAGFDFKAGSAGLFVEGRFHDVFTTGKDLQFIPITIGIRLGGH